MYTHCEEIFAKNVIFTQDLSQSPQPADVYASYVSYHHLQCFPLYLHLTAEVKTTNCMKEDPAE